MDWTSQFIIYRINSENSLEEVYHPLNYQKAKYILQYVAEVGDVCCRTPKHPRHSGKSKRPEYVSHKTGTHSTLMKEQEWRKFADDKSFSGEFPEEQLSMPSDG